jgi:hypothetical protein
MHIGLALSQLQPMVNAGQTCCPQAVSSGSHLCIVHAPPSGAQMPQLSLQQNSPCWHVLRPQLTVDETSQPQPQSFVKAVPSTQVNSESSAQLRGWSERYLSVGASHASVLTRGSGSVGVVGLLGASFTSFSRVSLSSFLVEWSWCFFGPTPSPRLGPGSVRSGPSSTLPVVPLEHPRTISVAIAGNASAREMRIVVIVSSRRLRLPGTCRARFPGCQPPERRLRVVQCRAIQRERSAAAPRDLAR